MNKVDYIYYKAMFEAFGKDILVEFARMYAKGLPEVDTKHTKEEVAKSAAKCFMMYIAATKDK